MRIYTILIMVGWILAPFVQLAGQKTVDEWSVIADEVKRSSVFDRAFTGFALFNPENGQTLVNVNADKLFTPASNVKIYTLYACLRELGDSLPSGFWSEDEHQIRFTPTGDPTFLHPYFQAWQPVFHDFIHAGNKAIVIDDRFKGMPPLGPGWCWDDTDFEYSAERTFFPIFGNVKRVFALSPDSLCIQPAYWSNKLFKDQWLVLDPRQPWMHDADNTLTYGGNTVFKNDYQEWLAVRGVDQHLGSLLFDTLHRNVIIGTKANLIGPTLPQRLRYACPLDTVLRRMMQESDNFLAEQLLYCASGSHSNYAYLNQDSMIRWLLNNVLTDLPQKPRWVDGSGLSRYNLTSPNNNIRVLYRLWNEVQRDRLLSLFPAGGQSGTMADWYRSRDGKPYVYAKTGTLGGVHCLSGYVRTKSGKWLIFSFMHNNYTGGSRPFRAEIQRILEMIYNEKYLIGR